MEILVKIQFSGNYCKSNLVEILVKIQFNGNNGKDPF